MIPSASRHKDKRTSQTIASDRSRLRATLRAIVKSSHPALHAIVAALDVPAKPRVAGTSQVALMQRKTGDLAHP